MKIDEFPSFLRLEQNETADALRRLQEKDAVELAASPELAAGWAEWPDG